MNDAAPPAPTTAGMGRGHARLIAAALFVIPLALAPLFPPDDWYAGLRTSRLTPPGWVFGPVWTVLYLLLAIAVQRILVARAARRTDVAPQ